MLVVVVVVVVGVVVVPPGVITFSTLSAPDEAREPEHELESERPN